VPNERMAVGQLAVYAAIETNQVDDARKIAEALFKPKTSINNEGYLIEPATEKPITVTRTPRIFNVEGPRAQSSALAEPTHKNSSGATEHQTTKPPRSAYGRIRALATYGLTLRQIADLYEVAEIEIEYIVER
jgi:hypothetical protein